MNIKKRSYVRIFSLIVVVLAGIGLAFFLFDTLTRSETIGPLTTVTIPEANNSSIQVWTKALKTSNGFSLLKSDSYNVLAVNVLPSGVWISPGGDNKWLGDNKWSVHIVIVGFGATRSDYGLIRANGLKKVVFGLEFGPYTDFRYLGFYQHLIDNRSGYYSLLLNAVANSSGVVPVSAFLSQAINESVDHETELPFSFQHTKPGDMDYYPIRQWLYTEPLAGDNNNAIFVGEVMAEIAPGKNVEVNISSTFTSGFFDSSRNDIRLTFNLPPDPDTLTPQQREQNNISIHNGLSSQYDLDYINFTVE